MKLNVLTSENYRNTEKQTVRFGTGINLLYGENGAGKTNLLEAVNLFAICKSHRTVKDGDFVRHGRDYARLSLCFSSELDRENTTRHAEMIYSSDGKKRLFYEGVAIPKVSEFIGRFRAVLFTPDHLSLIKGSPELRRNFCDMAMCQIRPGYIHALNDYAKLLGQRNALLKNFRENGGKGDRDLLAVYSDALAEKGAIVSRQRLGFCRYLEHSAKEFYKTISGGSEELKIRYFGSVRSEEVADPTENDLKSRLSELYRGNVDSEIRQGATKYGPHREDLLFFMERKSGDEKEFLSQAENTENGENPNTDEHENTRAAEFAARTFASQGQQRSAVLALKAAEGEMIRDLCGEYPVYLFDDVLSELDKGRKERFIDLFSNKQVLLTCCDEAAAASIDGTKIYVHDGKYEENGKLKVENGKFEVES